jgi:hypothetical protein
VNRCRAAAQLRAQPRARIIDPPAIVETRAETEPVQGMKGDIHR